MDMSGIIVTFTVTPLRQKLLDNLKQWVHYVASQITDVIHIKLAACISEHEYKCISFKSSNFYVVYEETVET
jgi:hypothetical protein